MEEDLFQNGSIVLHNRILGQVADLHVGISDNASCIGFQGPRQHLQEGGLAGAVDADDAHLVPFVEIEIYVRQQLPAAKIDGKMFSL